jgi:hypothetical protein
MSVQLSKCCFVSENEQVQKKGASERDACEEESKRPATKKNGNNLLTQVIVSLSFTGMSDRCGLAHYEVRRKVAGAN